MKTNIILLLAACAWIGTGCTAHHHEHSEGEEHHHEHTEAHEHDHSHEHEGHDHHADSHGHIHIGASRSEKHSDDEIILHKKEADAIGLTTKTVRPEAFHEVIKCSGVLSNASGDERTVVAPVSGVVSFGNKSLVEGMAVKNGQPMLSLSAGSLSEGDRSERVRIAYGVARRNYERAEVLVKDRIISQKEFDQIEQEYKNSRMAYEAIGRDSIQGMRVTAPIGGFVKSVLVNEGDYVAEGQPLVQLSKNSRLRLQAEVSERYLNRLPSIVTAKFKMPYEAKVYSLDDMNGRMLGYGRSAAGSFYVPVSFEFDNRANLVSGSYVEVFLVSSPEQNVLIVPQSALAEEQGLYFVYLKEGEEVYKKQEVAIGATDGENVRIVSGVKPGDEVVTRGVYQVRLAANSGVIPEGHSHNH